jgi:hypothetical protein
MRRVFVLVLACAAFSGCDNSSSTPQPTPLPLLKETFPGNLVKGGSASHNFTVGQAGEVDVTLTAAGPPPTITMGLGVGIPNTATGACDLIPGASVNAQASAFSQLLGSASPGALCVKISDIGNQTGPITYTIVVEHT